MSGRPSGTPLGITLTSVGREVGRAFDEALGAAGGSLPTWLVLLALKRDPHANQRTLAERVGIRGATLTHHLNAMEEEGLVTRRRDPANRRVHIVELSASGEAAFHRLRAAAAAFDQRLRAGLDEAEIAGLRRVLDQLRANARGDTPVGPAPICGPTTAVPIPAHQSEGDDVAPPS